MTIAESTCRFKPAYRTNRQGDLPVALWNPLRADALPAGVDLSVFDMGVNAGIWGSARLLQRAVGFTGEEVDGCIGPETLAAAGKWDPRTLVNDLAKQQLAYYRTLSDFPTFGTGWLNRTEARRKAALANDRSQRNLKCLTRIGPSVIAAFALGLSACANPYEPVQRAPVRRASAAISESWLTIDD